MKNNQDILPVYTEKDYDSMGWHDCTIYGMSLPRPGEYELIFDLDYIFEWIDPEPGSEYYSFKVAKATLCFEKVHDLKINIETDETLEIEGIQRISDKEWLIECQEGTLELKAAGFKQYTRERPKKISEQAIGRSADGCSFSKKTFQDKS